MSQEDSQGEWADEPIPCNEWSGYVMIGKTPSNIITGNIYEELLKLSPEERMQILNKFCKYCGSSDPRCVCWNDK